MNLSEPIAALEIGTTSTVIAVANPIGPGRISIAACCEIPSSSVRKSQIIDIGQASASISSVLKRLENDSEYSIARAALAVCACWSGRIRKTFPCPALPKKVASA
jgi:cell division ATPase FtsA